MANNFVSISNIFCIRFGYTCCRLKPSILLYYFTFYSRQKVLSPPYFITHPALHPTPLFQILSPPLPSTNLHLHCFFRCLHSLAEWVIMLHLMCYCTSLYYESTSFEPLYLTARRTLKTVFHTTRRQVN